jgi:hypothetical protein
MAATCDIETAKIARTQMLVFLNWDTVGETDNPQSIDVNGILGGADAALIKVITIPLVVTTGYDLELFDALGNSVFDLTGLSDSASAEHRIEAALARLVTIGGSGYRIELSDHGGADKQGQLVLWLSY